MVDLAPAPAQAMTQVFTEIDRVEALAGSVVAQVSTRSGHTLELHVGPGRACFHETDVWSDYELVLPEDFVPPGWLHRYSTGEQSVYGMVPRTMLTHLVSRLGGVVRAVVEPSRAITQLHLMVTVPADLAEEVAAALRRTLSKKLPEAPARINLVREGRLDQR